MPPRKQQVGQAGSRPKTKRGAPKPPANLGGAAVTLADIHRKNAHRGTSVDVIYATIREAVRSRQVHPGTHLTELELAAALRVSRTPVREALQRLETEYLLEKCPRRGFVVPTLGLNDIVEIFELREVLMGLAARCAAQRAGPAEVAMMAETVVAMERAYEIGDAGGLSQASAQFHRAMEQASKNRRLQNLIRLNSGPLPLYEFADPDRFAPAIAEHRAILDAIAAHDSARAERLATEHSHNALKAQIRATQKPGDGSSNGE